LRRARLSTRHRTRIFSEIVRAIRQSSIVRRVRLAELEASVKAQAQLAHRNEEVAEKCDRERRAISAEEQQAHKTEVQARRTQAEVKAEVMALKTSSQVAEDAAGHYEAWTKRLVDELREMSERARDAEFAQQLGTLTPSPPEPIIPETPPELKNLRAERDGLEQKLARALAQLDEVTAANCLTSSEWLEAKAAYDTDSAGLRGELQEMSHTLAHASADVSRLQSLPAAARVAELRSMKEAHEQDMIQLRSMLHEEHTQLLEEEIARREREAPSVSAASDLAVLETELQKKSVENEMLQKTLRSLAWKLRNQQNFSCGTCGGVSVDALFANVRSDIQSAVGN